MRKFKKISKFIKEFRFYNKRKLVDAASSFSNKQFSLFIGLVIIAAISLVGVVGKVNNMFLVDIPSNGGEITEGILGSPTLVNPVLAFSYADKDLTALIYSGLMRKTPEGEMIPDLAEQPPTISPDGTVYTFTLKENIKFHNGEKITADDIVFTIEKIKDPFVKSPQKTN